MSVLKQFPDAEAVVKRNRTVYLTVNRVVPPTIEMPQLVNLTYRNADVTLRQYGLKLGDTMYRFDFAKNSVLDQLHNGQSIKPGTKIQMGATIDLVLGSGVTGMQVQVPDLIGLTLDEARTLLQINGLSFALVMPQPDVTDTANAYIYWQNPSHFTDDGRVNIIHGGQTLDVRTQVEKPVRNVDSPRAVMPPPPNQ